MDPSSVARPDRCDRWRMCLTPVGLRSPLLLSRHGTRYIRHRRRHAGWLSIGRRSPCGSRHMSSRLEAADGQYAWVDPAEHWQAGRQQPKQEWRKERNSTNARRNDSQEGLLTKMPKYRPGDERRSVIPITSHRFAIYGLAARSVGKGMASPEEWKWSGNHLWMVRHGPAASKMDSGRR